MKPIIVSPEEIRQVLAGATQLRQRIDPQPVWLGEPMNLPGSNRWSDGCGGDVVECPFGIGDEFYVQEEFYLDERNPPKKTPQEVIYATTPEWALDHAGILQRVRFIDMKLVPPDEAKQNIEANKFWHLRPASEMAEWASRLHLTITSVSIENTDGWHFVAGFDRRAL